MKTKVLLALSFAAILGAASGFAQMPEGIHVYVPYKFVVERTTLPAGQYDFIPIPDREAVQVIAVGKGSSASAVIVTRLAGDIHTTPNDAHVVFDVIGDTRILSELWVPGMDGFLLHVTKEKHKHQVINVPA